MLNQRMNGTVVRVPQNRRMPGTRNGLPERRVGMQRKHQRRPTRCLCRSGQNRINGIVIGAMIAIEPPLPLLVRDRMVAGHDGAIGDFHDQRRIVLAAIGIDQQARESAENGRHAKARRKLSGQTFHTNVISDMALERGLR